MGAKKNKAKAKAKGKDKAKKSKGKDTVKKTSLAPKPVKTGKGATPLEVAQSVAALIRDGASHEVEDRWLARGIESVEGVGASMAWRGKQAVLAKYRGWEADHEIHELKLEGPWVGATGFALKFWIDVTQKSTGQRTQMEEIAVYTVERGKIVREEFHFRAG
ncbi:MAG: nuclear transport factor 2 family protein [Myxococcota bacterium]|nr:nuclear transport factor 2 family protein [Myxococcota bacterium]